MSWSAEIFVVVALGVVYGLFAFLRAALVRASSNRFSAYRLGMAALPLILVGAVTLDLRENIFFETPLVSTNMRTVNFLLENFGWLLVQSGLIFLFILFCVSLMRTSAKANDKSENAVGEYLR